MYNLRSSRLAPLAARTGARPQPFLPIGAARTSMGREPLMTRCGVRQTPSRSLAPLAPDDPPPPRAEPALRARQRLVDGRAFAGRCAAPHATSAPTSDGRTPQSAHTVLRVRRTDQRNSSWLEKVGVCTLILALRRVVIPQRCIDIAWGVLRTPAWALFTLFLEKE